MTPLLRAGTYGDRYLTCDCSKFICRTLLQINFASATASRAQSRGAVRGSQPRGSATDLLANGHQARGYTLGFIQHYSANRLQARQPSPRAILKFPVATDGYATAGSIHTMVARWLLLLGQGGACASFTAHKLFSEVSNHV
jgi:hypothetical protein